MINTITRTYKAKGHNVNVVEASIYYRKGGMNWMTGQNEERGYVFSISPYEVSGCWRTYRGFSGAKTLVLPCERQSKKRYEQAKAMMDDLVNMYLDTFCEDRGIELLGYDYEQEESER